MQFSQLNYSMVNIKICKCIPYIVCARSYSFRNIKFKKIYIKNVGQGHGLQFSQLFEDKCENLQMSPTYFFASSNRFRDINYKFHDVQKVGQGHGVKVSKYTNRWQMSKSVKRNFFISYFR